MHDVIEAVFERFDIVGHARSDSRDHWTLPYRWTVPTYLRPSAESLAAICESPSCTTDATSAPSRVNTLPRAIARPPSLDATCCE